MVGWYASSTQLFQWVNLPNEMIQFIINRNIYYMDINGYGLKIDFIKSAVWFKPKRTDTNIEFIQHV